VALRKRINYHEVMPNCRFVSCIALLAACGRGGFDQTAEYQNSVLHDQPLAFYRLNEPSGKVAIDESGGGHDASYQITTTGVINHGKIGALLDGDSAVFLSGTGNSDLAVSSGAGVRLPRSINPWANDFSVEVFVKPSIPPDKWHGALFVWEEYKTSGFRTGWTPELVPELWTDEAGGVPIIDIVRSKRAMRADDFNHLVFVHRGATFLIYQDGVEVASKVIYYVPPNNVRVSDPGLGAGHGMPSDGVFDELSIYDYALSPEQIAVHAAARFWHDEGFEPVTY
jgi:hypothetical protein